MSFEVSYEIRKVLKDKDELVSTLKQKSGYKTIGILIFGPDFSSKPEIFNEFSAIFPHIAKIEEASEEALKSLNGYILDGVEECGIALMMNGDDSASKIKRQKMVNIMRNMGCEIVIGVYANRWICEKDDDLKLMFLRNTQVDNILKDPPTARDFDYFVIVS